jgi:benzodiazapine receptor
LPGAARAPESTGHNRNTEDFAFDTPETSRRGAPSLLALIGFVGLCLLVGAAGGAVTSESVRTWYLTLDRPPGVPPNWMFPVVWTTLYIMIGTAAWLVWRQAGHHRALRLWGWQLLLNAVWTPAFFGLHSPALGLAIILPLLVLIVLTVRAFLPLDRRAALLLLPYGLWCVYATYLNAGFLWLNPG